MSPQPSSRCEKFLERMELSKPSRSLSTGPPAPPPTVVDRDPGPPRGMAFVEMSQATAAQAAISALDGKTLNGRPMRVNEARPQLHREPKRDTGNRDHRRHRT